MTSSARSDAAAPRRRLFGALLGAAVLLTAGRPAAAAQTSPDPSPMATTLVVLRLDTAEPVAIRTTFLDQPPIISIEFPERRVIGSLPEESAIRTGVIQGIATRYDEASTAGPSGRPIRGVNIRLSAPYAHRVRSETGRVVVEIEHPSSIRGASVEVGVRGGAVVKGFLPQRVSERFLAMEQALVAARPSESPIAASSARRPAPAAPAAGPAVPAPRAAPPAALAPPVEQASGWSWPIAGLAAAAGLLVLGWAWRRAGRASGRRAAPEPGQRLPSSLLLIDQLVWHAFERQGYQLLQTAQLAEPPGTLRIMTKDGDKALLSCVGNGTFFEKQAVERFIQAMRAAGASQGFLVASGAFTVPAQRRAKDAHVTLMGREQLTELLSAGAMTEHFTRQVQEAMARLEESRETLRQYAEQLDTLRRQRNEASWHLGEERARTGKLDAQLDEAAQQVRHLATELERSQRETEAFRKQWEESQWYLGESRERSRHLERQVGELQAAEARAETAQRERDETRGQLGQIRGQLEEQLAKAAQLQRALDESVQRELLLQDAFDAIRRTLSALQTYGERRRAARAVLREASIELRNGRKTAALPGALYDVSITGVGLGTEREIEAASLRVRLQIPGIESPIESRAQLVWQVSEGDPPRYRSGFRFVGLPSTSREHLEGIIAQHSGG